jgi:hypothetical protein
MEIGPITAVRPVSMIKPLRGSPDLSRVYEVEYLGQSTADEYTPANGKAERGLDDEEGDAAEETANGATEAEGASHPSTVSFFA